MFLNVADVANTLVELLWNATHASRSTDSRPLNIEVTQLNGPVVMAEDDIPQTQASAVDVTADESSQSKKKGKASRKSKNKSKDTAETSDASAVHQNQTAVSNAFEDAQVQELADLDDWSSAWEDVKASGERWGGRGKGGMCECVSCCELCGELSDWKTGRGIQRSTFQPKDVFVEGVTLAYHGKELLLRTQIHFVHGHRYGIVGNNGVGKTTLLRRIATQTLPGFPLHLRCFLVRQEV